MLASHCMKHIVCLFLGLLACSDNASKQAASQSSKPAPKAAPDTPQTGGGTVDDHVVEATKELERLRQQAESYYASVADPNKEKNDTWKALDFAMTDPHYYAYAFVGDAGSKKPHTTLPTPTGSTGVRDCDSLVRDVPQAELITRYGSPDSTSEFMATEGAGEMRVELLNDYPPSNPASAKTKILEQTWDGDEFHFVVWLHKKNNQWVGLQAISYQEGVEF